LNLYQIEINILFFHHPFFPAKMITKKTNNRFAIQQISSTFAAQNKIMSNLLNSSQF